MVYGIIGNPVSHSLSPLMHNAAFASLGENRIYLPFPVKDIADAVKGIRSLNIRGVSVTIPHKESIVAFLDEVDPVALKIGAVNTVNRVDSGPGGLLCGSNSDWLGACRALKTQTDLRGRNVVVLGAGGSARAIAFGLQHVGAEVLLCSRTESRGRKLADDIGCAWYPLADIGRLSASVLINATSVGMAPNVEDSLVPFECLEQFAVVMDIVYSPVETRLLREARAKGCRTVNGLDMLLHQGVVQFELWTGLTAPIEVMRDALQRAVGSSE